MTALRRPTQLYDVVILGRDLTGLIAGALLAKRGFRVLQVDDGRPDEERIEEGYRLPLVPNLFPSPRALPSFAAVLDELGLMPTVGRLIEPYPAGLQIILPDARLNLFAGAQERKRELIRAFGPAAAGLDTSLGRIDPKVTTWLEAASQLPAMGIRERWGLRGLSKKLHGEITADVDLGGLGESLRSMSRILAPSAGGRLGFSRTLLPLLSQPSRLRGPGLSQVLRSYIASRMGDILGPSATMEELSLEKGAFAGIRLAGLTEAHRGRVALAACAPGRVEALLAGKKAQRKVSLAAETVEAGGRHITLNLVLEKRAIPPGAEELALIAGFGPEPVLSSWAPTIGADGKPIPDLVTVAAMGSFPLGEEAGAAADGIKASLEEVFPFFQRHLRFESLVEVGPSQLRVSRKRQMELEGLPLQSPVPHLLWCSDQVLPGLGLEGRLLAGMRAAEAAAALCKKAKGPS